MCFALNYFLKMGLKKQKQKTKRKTNKKQKKAYQLIHYKFVVKSGDDTSARLNEFTKLLL